MAVGCRFFQPIRTAQYFESCYPQATNFHTNVKSTELGLVAALEKAEIEDGP
jgi:hypothetical protein